MAVIFEVAAGIILAVVVLAMGYKALIYLERRKASKIELSDASEELQQLQGFLADGERVRPWKALQLKCEFSECYLRDKKSPVPEIAATADDKLEEAIQKFLSEADDSKDQYCKAAMLHSISKLMCKSGQFERANKLIGLIDVNVIRENAIEDFTEETRRLAQVAVPAAIQR